MIELTYSKLIGNSVLTISVLTIAINLSVLFLIYKKKSLRTSSTAIIVCNLACVDILVTAKDAMAFFDVGSTGIWKFDENACSMYGLRSVIFIIISVSTLVTIYSERFLRLREISTLGTSGLSSMRLTSNNPLVFGYVIAHTTLSYSLSLLWSKYVFLTRKAFCKVEWPRSYGFPISLLSSIIFIVPVSILVYNALFNGSKSGDNSDTSSQLQKTKSEIICTYEQRAQKQLYIATSIFLFSWTPYVTESLLSTYFLISPNIGILVACLPLLTTSLLPLFYVTYASSTFEKNPNEYKVIMP